MTRRGLAVLLTCLVAATVALSAGEDVRITPIPSDGRVLVSLVVRDAWTLGTREVLQSGVTVRFEYEIDLRRPAAVWFFGAFDPVLARGRVSSWAASDKLMGGYKVTRMRDGRIVKSERRDQEADVRDWLTTVDQVALDPVEPLEPNAEYYVHVRVTTSPRRSVSLWSLLPLGRDEITARQTFTYIK
jgi:hypothetical protein